jgi:ATP-dependent RNA helicase DDX60
VFYLLQDFTLSLMTIRNVIEQLLLKASQEVSRTDPDVSEDTELDSGYGTFDPDMDGEEQRGANEEGFKRPKGVSDLDWQVYEVVDGALREFDEKYRAMWA